MTLLGRILEEKRGAVVSVAVILALDGGLYAFAVYPWSHRVSRIEAQARAADARLEQMRASYEAIREANASKSHSDSELERFYTEVLPSDLAGAREISWPLLASLAADANLVLERRTSVPEKEGESRLARLRTTMVLAGRYEDIRQFIYELETAPEFIVIEEIILSQGDESDEALVLTLGVSTYYWTGPDAGS